MNSAQFELDARNYEWSLREVRQEICVMNVKCIRVVDDFVVDHDNLVKNIFLDILSNDLGNDGKKTLTSFSIRHSLAAIVSRRRVQVKSGMA